MKKIILCLALAGISISAMAQNKGWYISPDVAIGYSTNVHFKQFDDNNINAIGKDNKAAGKLYLSGSLKAGYVFTSHIGVFTGIGMQSFSFEFNPSGLSAQPGTEEIVAKYTQNYFTIPLYARFAICKPNKIGFFSNAGVRVGILTNSTVKYSNLPANFLTGTGTESQNALFNTVNCSAFVNAGMVIPVNSRITLDLGPEFQYSLTKNFKENVYPKQGNLLAISFKAGVNILLFSEKGTLKNN